MYIIELEQLKPKKNDEWIMFGLIYLTALVKTNLTPFLSLVCASFRTCHSVFEIGRCGHLVRVGGRSPVPPAIIPNHGHMIRLL